MAKKSKADAYEPKFVYKITDKQSGETLTFNPPKAFEQMEEYTACWRCKNWHVEVTTEHGSLIIAYDIDNVEEKK